MDTKNTLMQTAHKTLAANGLSIVAVHYPNYLDSKERESIQRGDKIEMVGRTLKHRFLTGGATGIVNIIDSNTSKIAGISDFNKEKIAEDGFYIINAIAIATTDEIPTTTPVNDLGIINFRSALTASDAILQNAKLKIEVDGNEQPAFEGYLGDMMTKYNTDNPRGNEYFMDQSLYIPRGKSLKIQIEYPQGPTARFNELKTKAVELSLIGMKVVF